MFSNLFIMGCLLDFCKKRGKKKNDINKSGNIEIELDLIKENETKTIKYNNKNISLITNSKVGFYNAGGSCYMASIIQILIHLRSFIEIFLRKKQKNNVYKIFYNLLLQIINSKGPIEITEFSNEYNKINEMYSGSKGNNPMTFFDEFIKQLDKENNDIVNLFNGKNLIQFNGSDEENYEENFIFFMVCLDSNYRNIDQAIHMEKEVEDEQNIKISSKIILKPKIFVINLEVDNLEYYFEQYIQIDGIKYELKAINEYNDFHSKV